MDATTNSLNWFEIPVADFDRARHFYQVIFSMHMPADTMMGMQMAFFPSENGSGKVSGALVKSEAHIPSTHGSLIYLNANPAMDGVLELIAAEGAQILLPKTEIAPGMGYIAFFMDTEGNKVGLHSME